MNWTLRHAALVALVVTARAAPAAMPAVPVHVGGDAQLDACGTLGAVTGLDPRGDNFLSVRSGPGGKPFGEVDRLHTGRQVTVCEQRGAWLGIVYAPGGRTIDCGTATPRPRATPYAGACRSGWVHRRYVRVIAG